MIYFMQSVDGGAIKIGFSDNANHRREALESHYGQPLAILATIEGGREKERELHERFAHIRLGRTEQFKPTAELLTFIGRPLLVGENPEAVEAMPVVSNRAAMVLQMRGSQEWKDWLRELAAFDDRSDASLGERAIHRYALAIGFDEKPPER